MKCFATILFLSLSLLSGGSLLSKSLLRYSTTLPEYAELAETEEAEVDTNDQEESEGSEQENENGEDKVMLHTVICFLTAPEPAIGVDSSTRLSLLSCTASLNTPPPELSA